MAAKLIMKRKRQQDLCLMENETESQLMPGTVKARQNAEEEYDDCQHKRNKLESATQTSNRVAATATTTSTEPANAALPATHNPILLEALQKIIELQQELDAFEHDLDESDYHDDAEVSFYLEEEELHQRTREHVQRDTDEYRRHEAEAIGFAMCARETMLFLQREGISSDSLLYRSLHQRLIGQSDDIIPI